MLAKEAVKNWGNDWLPQLWRTIYHPSRQESSNKIEELLESEEDEQPATASVSGEEEEGTDGAKVVCLTNHVENRFHCRKSYISKSKSHYPAHIQPQRCRIRKQILVNFNNGWG